MQEYTVDSLTDLFRLCFDTSSSFFNDEHFFIFRGQSNTEWGLEPAIFRKYLLPPTSVVPRIGGDIPVYAGKNGLYAANISAICNIERVIYSEFFERLRGYPQIQVDKNNLWEMLCIAQHFNVPTRLLDWTENLAIATYFCVVELPNRDGAVWCLNATQTAKDHNYLGFLNEYDRKRGISRINNLPSTASIFTPQVEQHARPNDANYGFRILQAPHLELRMKNQGSFFTVDVTTKDYSHKESNAPTHFNHVDICNDNLVKVTIPATAKRAIKKDLEKIGTNYNLIFPDLAGLGMYLRDLRDSLIDLELSDPMDW